VDVTPGCALQALARVVYVHICLLLESEAQSSPTRSLVWRAEQCLREWDRLEKAGLTQGAGVLDPRHVAALQRWAKTADSDLYLAEALHGTSLPPNKTLQVRRRGAWAGLACRAWAGERVPAWRLGQGHVRTVGGGG
jgi:hypothetical protein